MAILVRRSEYLSKVLGTVVEGDIIYNTIADLITEYYICNKQTGFK